MEDHDFEIFWIGIASTYYVCCIAILEVSSRPVLSLASGEQFAAVDYYGIVDGFTIPNSDFMEISRGFRKTHPQETCQQFPSASHGELKPLIHCLSLREVYRCPKRSLTKTPRDEEDDEPLFPMELSRSWAQRSDPTGATNTTGIRLARESLKLEVTLPKLNKSTLRPEAIPNPEIKFRIFQASKQSGASC